MNNAKVFMKVFVIICVIVSFAIAAFSQSDNLLQAKNAPGGSRGEGYIPGTTDLSDRDYPSGQDEEAGYLEWLERIRYAIIVGDDQKPTVYFEATQPIYQDPEKLNTFFYQPRISMQDDLTTYNLGVGYRRLLFEKQLLLGVNTFLDYQDHHNHHRIGVGGEAFTKYLEFRMNGYFATSKRVQVNEDNDYIFYERVVPGMDASIGGPIPYLPWLKAFFGGYWYDYRKFKDKEGWQVRLEAKPVKYITVNYEWFRDSKTDGKDADWRVDMRASIPFHSFDVGEMFASISMPSQPYPVKNLEKMTLIRVERNNKIEVESYAEAKLTGLTVEIGRK